MKRRISDMLDHYPAADVAMEHSAPLSSQRIKELTMSKINHKEKKGKRVAFRVLIAAATIAALTMTVYAAEEIWGAGDWFRDILNNALKESKTFAAEEKLDVTIRETISEGQIQVVNELGKNFQPITQTSEGTTMTLTAAYADENILNLYLQAEAPEGTALPDGISYIFYDPEEKRGDTDGEFWRPVMVGEDAPYDRISGLTIKVTPLADADPADNKKDFHIVVTGQPDQEMKFNDGYAKYLNITGIYQQVADTNDDEDSYVLLAPGEFSFDVGIVSEAKMVELEVDGLTYGGHKTRTWTHEGECIASCDENLTGETDPETGLPIHAESWDYTVTARSLSISPLSANWACDFEVRDGDISCGLDFLVVMKDGTSPITWYDGGGYSETSSFGTATFDTPIDLNEVDYILIGDPEINSTHKVYLP